MSRHTLESIFIQGSYWCWNPGKPWNFTLAFSRTRKSWKMTTSPGKAIEIGKLCFDYVIFTVSIACGTACKAYSKNKVIVDVATG